MTRAEMITGASFLIEYMRSRGELLLSPTDIFRNAAVAPPPEAVELLQLLRNHDAFEALGAVQTDGFIADPGFISLRDLYAFRRGTGYFGEDITTEREGAFAALTRASDRETARQAEITRRAEAMIADATELRQLTLTVGAEVHTVYSYVGRDGALHSDVSRATYERAARLLSERGHVRVREEGSLRTLVVLE